jgi:hypothetical protein
VTARRALARAALAVGAVLLALSIAARLIDLGDDRGAGRLTRPIDPRQQTAVPFGERSHWLQPWRAYLDTVPAVRLRAAIGINFNVAPEEARRTARLLALSGIRRARIEVGWSELDYEDPTRLEDPSRMAALLGALQDNGIRPLILLNAHHNRPTPAQDVSFTLAAVAPRGAREVRLDLDRSEAVAPGLTGIDDPDGKAADVILTSVSSDGTATLSKPLPRDLAAGTHEATTLRYPPFGRPHLADGTPNPAFEQTLQGWLEYVGAVTREARRVLGSQDFDVEIWNELSFGSDFLNQDRYYDPPREFGKGEVESEILERTVAYLRDPANGVEDVGIGDGFANQTPFAAGSTSSPGLTAIDKHLYYPARRFPQDAEFNSIVPLDANGRPSSTERRQPGREPIHRDRFVPKYISFFPERALSAIGTETLIRDLSPITTEVYGTPHGRDTAPPAGTPPTVWITETGLDPSSGPAPLGPEDVERLHAKAALRYYTAFVNKGVSAVYLFAVKGGNLALVHPEERGGGETLRAVRRLTSELTGPNEFKRTRPLSLLEVSDDHGKKQFEGDGSSAHPPLYDRDVVAFFPFQLRDGEYVAATYVMTRNLAKLYDEGGAGDRTRYDLPPERFRLRIGGLDGRKAEVSGTDPLTGRRVVVNVEERTRDGLTVALPLTDSPRLLRLSTR